ncbi:MAG TPA: autotransporter-associated beta strand repeat-containing protein, partial [Tepidisphaeraceae bacterium]|nr:autotransporter-associated beta strand repeat-containing protein [Tepidisphaeraceae bacterium]
MTATVAALAAATSFGVSRLAWAGNTWTGNGASANWSDDNNWGGAQPAYGTLSFNLGGTQGTTSIVDQSYSMNQLLWTGTSAWTVNSANAAVISLFDLSGTQAKVENQSSGLVTLNAPITFAATAGANWGEINAVNGDLTFGTGMLTVNGSQVAGIRSFTGAGRTVTFNNTVSASGKYLALTASTSGTITIGSSANVTIADLYIMNGGTLNLGGSTLTNDSGTGVRLGGDFGTTGTQDLTKGGTFNLTATGGGTTYAGVINSVALNTSGALAVNSNNTSGANTLSGHVALDSALQFTQASGGTLNITQARAGGVGTTTGTDIKGQSLTLTPASGGTINFSGDIYNSTGAGSVLMNGAGTVTLGGANTYTGATTISAGILSVTGAINSANAANVGRISVANTSGNAELLISGTVRATNTTAPSLLVGSVSGANGTIIVNIGGT